jgi:hypothetical protein
MSARRVCRQLSSLPECTCSSLLELDIVSHQKRRLSILIAHSLTTIRERLPLLTNLDRKYRSKILGVLLSGDLMIPRWPSLNSLYTLWLDIGHNVLRITKPRTYAIHCTRDCPFSFTQIEVRIFDSQPAFIDNCHVLIAETDRMCLPMENVSL